MLIIAVIIIGLLALLRFWWIRGGKAQARHDPNPIVLWWPGVEIKHKKD